MSSALHVLRVAAAVGEEFGLAGGTGRRFIFTGCGGRVAAPALARCVTAPRSRTAPQRTTPHHAAPPGQQPSAATCPAEEGNGPHVHTCVPSRGHPFAQHPSIGTDNDVANGTPREFLAAAMGARSRPIKSREQRRGSDGPDGPILPTRRMFNSVRCDALFIGVWKVSVFRISEMRVKARAFATASKLGALGQFACNLVFLVL
ncbi:unnamed protein product, partial [Iphiclides podalirius]